MYLSLPLSSEDNFCINVIICNDNAGSVAHCEGGNWGREVLSKDNKAQSTYMYMHCARIYMYIL